MKEDLSELRSLVWEMKLSSIKDRIKSAWYVIDDIRSIALWSSQRHVRLYPESTSIEYDYILWVSRWISLADHKCNISLSRILEEMFNEAISLKKAWESWRLDWETKTYIGESSNEIQDNTSN